MMPPEIPSTDIDPETKDFLYLFARHLIESARGKESNVQSLKSHKPLHWLLRYLSSIPLLRHLSIFRPLWKRWSVRALAYDTPQSQKLMNELVSATVAAYEEVHKQSASATASRRTHLPSDTSQKIN